MPDEKKKSLFDKAVDALTDRDEKAVVVKAKHEAEVARKDAAALRAKMQAGKAVAAKAAMERTAAARAAAAPRKGTVTAKSLHIRKDHSTTSAEVGGLAKGEEVTVLEIWTDGKNTWAKLQNGWAAIVYNGKTYISLS
jgi:sRNA-binding protein